MTKEQAFPASVVTVTHDGRRVAINRGSLHGVRKGQRFVVYSLSNEEITDPATGESLGFLEMVKGTGVVLHVQEKMSTIESDMKRPEKTTVRRNRNPLFGTLGGGEEELVEQSTRVEPFEDAERGDWAKPI